MVKRAIPIIVATTTGFLVLLDYFVVNDELDALGQYVVRTASILAAFALLLGLINLLNVHLNKILDRDKGWGYSLVLLGAFIAHPDSRLCFRWAWLGPGTARLQHGSLPPGSNHVFSAGILLCGGNLSFFQD